MYEKNKISEARYFYSQMIKSRDNREVFIYSLSAFLSSARSVLQYAHKEAKAKPNGQKWYDGHISKVRVFKFFKNKRDINIHDEPIEPNKAIDINFKEIVHISESVSIILRNSDGKIKQQYNSEEPKQPQGTAYTPSIIKLRYKFDDWPGNEDVETLSKLYLDELEIFVNDGLKKGLITG